MEDIFTLSNRLQHEFDEPWSRARLIEDLPVWHKVWAACYAIGDTTLALGSYLKGPEDDEVGNLLLAVYGAFQALVIQQDALSHLAEIVGLPYKRPDEIRQIRKLRVYVCGHPVESGWVKDNSRQYHSITQVGLTRSRFTLGSDSEAPTPAEWREVELPKLIRLQFRHTHETLNAILQNAKQSNLEALKEFVGSPLRGFVLDQCPEFANVKKQPNPALMALNREWEVLLAEFRLRGSDHMLGFRYDLERLSEWVGSEKPDSVFTSEVEKLLDTCGEIDADFARQLRDVAG